MQRQTLHPLGLSSNDNLSSKPELKSSRITKVKPSINMKSTGSGSFNPIFEPSRSELETNIDSTINAHERYDKNKNKLNKIANRPTTKLASRLLGLFGKKDKTKERIAALKDKADIQLGTKLSKSSQPDNIQSTRFKSDALDNYAKAKEFNRKELKSIKGHSFPGVMPSQFMRRKTHKFLDDAHVNRLAI